MLLHGCVIAVRVIIVSGKVVHTVHVVELALVALGQIICQF